MKYPIGIQDFEKIITGGYVYVEFDCICKLNSPFVTLVANNYLKSEKGFWKLST